MPRNHDIYLEDIEIALNEILEKNIGNKSGSMMAFKPGG